MRSVFDITACRRSGAIRETRHKKSTARIWSAHPGHETAATNHCRRAPMRAAASDRAPGSINGPRGHGATGDDVRGRREHLSPWRRQPVARAYCTCRPRHCVPSAVRSTCGSHQYRSWCLRPSTARKPFTPSCGSRRRPPRTNRRTQRSSTVRSRHSRRSGGKPGEVAAGRGQAAHKTTISLPLVDDVGQARGGRPDDEDNDAAYGSGVSYYASTGGGASSSSASTPGNTTAMGARVFRIVRRSAKRRSCGPGGAAQLHGAVWYTTPMDAAGTRAHFRPATQLFRSRQLHTAVVSQHVGSHGPLSGACS
jgi:hypothetical protein